MTGRNSILGDPREWGFEKNSEKSEGISHEGIIGGRPNPAAAKWDLAISDAEKEGKQVINGIRNQDCIIEGDYG